MFENSQPTIATRGIHLDLKGLPPTFERLERLLEIFAQMRFNLLLVEWEDMFPWEYDRRLRTQGCYTTKQIDRFHRRCDELGLELVPLVQSLGHMNNLLQIDDYAHLRELPHETDCIHPLHEASGATVRALVDEVIDRSPNVRYFHLGGDEAWSLGEHPDSKRFVQQHGAAALYLHHVEPLLETLNARGIRPILWHDMMIHWSDADLTRVGKQADLMVWGYRGTPDQGLHHHRRGILDRMHQHGVNLWGASAYKGSDGTHCDLPNTAARLENNQGWAEASDAYQLKGVVATGWSRYWTSHIQVEPIDAVLPVLAQVACVLHDGTLPTDAATQSEAMIRALGEWDTAEPLWQELKTFQDACASAWLMLRQAEEFLAGLNVDPTRIDGGSCRRIFDSVRDRLKAVDHSANRLSPLMQGLVIEPWASVYAQPRVAAIRNYLESLEARHARLHAKPAVNPEIKVAARPKVRQLQP